METSVNVYRGDVTIYQYYYRTPHTTNNKHCLKNVNVEASFVMICFEF